MDQGYWSFQRTAGALLVAAVVPLALGVYLFLTRSGAGRDARFLFERGSILTAALLVALGFVLLEAALQATRGGVLARLGAGTFVVGAVALVPAETMPLAAATTYPLVVVYVLLAFLGQAAIGGALLRSRLLPAWIGWTTVGFNLGLLIVFLVVTPGDIYYPVAHHLMPLLIGVPLLSKAAA